MGNSQSCGFGALNNTGFPLTIGLSMGGTHYYENRVKPGEIFYRWPGAVYYTVFAYDSHPSRNITNAKCAKQIASIAVPLALGIIATAITAGVGFAGVAAGAGVAAVEGTVMAVEGAAVATETVSIAGPIIATSLSAASTPLGAAGFYVTCEKISKPKFVKPVYAAKRGCYGGGKGTWIEITCSDMELSDPHLIFEKKTIKEILAKGKFTEESYPKYYTKQQKEGK
eukprot:445037_1